MPEQTYMWLAGTTRYPCGCTGEGGKDGHTLTPCRLHASATAMRELLLRWAEFIQDTPYHPLSIARETRALLEETR